MRKITKKESRVILASFAATAAYNSKKLTKDEAHTFFLLLIYSDFF